MRSSGGAPTWWMTGRSCGRTTPRRRTSTWPRWRISCEAGADITDDQPGNVGPRVFARYQPGGLRPLLLHTLPVMKTLALCQNDIRELRHRNSIRGATSIRSPAQAAFSRNMVGMLRDAPAASGVATLSGKGSGKGDGKGKQARKVELAKTCIGDSIYARRR